MMVLVAAAAFMTSDKGPLLVMAMVLAQETGRDSAETTAPPWAWATANLWAGASAAGLATVSERDSAVGPEHALALASGAASGGP